MTARPVVVRPVVVRPDLRTPAYREELSGALVYPDVFWRHDAVGLRQ